MMARKRAANQKPSFPPDNLEAVEREFEVVKAAFHRLDKHHRLLLVDRLQDERWYPKRLDFQMLKVLADNTLLLKKYNGLTRGKDVDVLDRISGLLRDDPKMLYKDIAKILTMEWLERWEAGEKQEERETKVSTHLHGFSGFEGNSADSGRCRTRRAGAAGAAGGTRSRHRRTCKAPDNSETSSGQIRVVHIIADI
jgi:hypothetical protein